MSKLLGKALTSSLLGYLRMDPNLDEGRSILFLTNDSNGFPHIALLSLWELFATDESNIKVATYSGSITTSNLRKDGRATIVLIHSGNAYYIKGRASLVREKLRSDAYNSLFNLRVEVVLEDSMAGVRMAGVKYEGRSMVEQHGPLHQEISEVR